MPHDRSQNLKAAKALGIKAGADETIEKIRGHFRGWPIATYCSASEFGR